MLRSPSVPVLLLSLLAACTEAPPEAKKAREPEKPPEPVAGQYAFFQMYNAARGWIPDVQAVSLTSLPIPEVKAAGGKYGAWRAYFVSESRGRAKIFTYAVVESPANSIYKGVFAGHEEAYSRRGQTKPFLAAAVKKDSTVAYETAIGKGVEYSKKNPDKPITVMLELTPRFPNPAWRVIWGESAGTSNFSIYVDASTGEYLQTMR
ncbi:MAG: hypothetical protein ACRD44_18985 [Bryobacteraceae bacterium]